MMLTPNVSFRDEASCASTESKSDATFLSSSLPSSFPTPEQNHQYREEINANPDEASIGWVPRMNERKEIEERGPRVEMGIQ